MPKLGWGQPEGLTVERADEVVIGHDESQQAFDEKHFGTKRIITFGVDDAPANAIAS